MNNKFNINDYFTKWYGLGAAPVVNQLKLKPIGIIFVIAMLALTFVAHFACIIGVALCGFIFIGLPIMKKSKEQKARDIWSENFRIRSTTWHGEYDKFLRKILDDLNLRQRGMDKLGIDESQVGKKSEDNDDASGTEPFDIHGNIFKGYYRQDANGEYRTQYYEVTWIYCTTEQVLTYNIQLNLLDPSKKSEDTQEFFYDDIVSVSTSSQSVDVKAEQGVYDDKEGESCVESQAFKLVVPGDKILYSFTTTEAAVKAVKGLTQLIRDKKKAQKA